MAVLTIAWHCCDLADSARTTAEDSDEEGDWMEDDGLFDEPEAATNGRLSTSNIVSSFVILITTFALQ